MTPPPSPVADTGAFGFEPPLLIQSYIQSYRFRLFYIVFKYLRRKHVVGNKVQLLIQIVATSLYAKQRFTQIC